MQNTQVKPFSKKVRLITLAIAAAGVFFLFFYIKNILIEAGLFLACLIFMLKFGQFFILDVDPVPFSVILLLHLYDFRVALHFLLLALPVIDIVSSRFNHFSIINFASVLITISIFYLTPLSGTELYLGIIIFNVIRSIINIMVGLGVYTIWSNAIHTAIYFVIGSVIEYLV